MIGFYSRGIGTLAHAATSALVWVHRHPWKARILTIVLLDIVIVIFGNTYAYAAGSESPLSPFLPGGDIHDSSGIPLVNYTSLPIDRGDLFTPEKFVIAQWVSPIWTGHLGAIAWMLWLFDFLLSFEWVSWISVPFANLAGTIEGLLGDLNWIPLALMVAALVCGIAVWSGRKAAGGLDIAISIVCAILAGGILANPVATLTATGGALDVAQSFGSEIATAVVADGESDGSLVSDDALSESVVTQLVDIFVRIPAQTVTFGHALTGDCAAVFDETMTSSAPIMGGGNTVRDRVGECDASAKYFVQNPTYGTVVSVLVVSVGGLVLYVFALVLALIFVMTVVFMLVAAIKTMWNVYLGILPVNRYPLWRSLADTFTGLVSLVFVTVALAAYLKIVVSVLTFMSTLGISIVQQLGFLVIFMIVMIILVWRIRRASNKAGRSFAEQLSRLGLASGGPAARDNTRALMTMNTVSTLGSALGRFTGKKAPAVTRPAAAAAAAAPSAMTDAGEMVATPMRPDGGTQKALPAAQKPSGAAQTADMVFTAINIAKAAPGGPAAMAAQAALAAGTKVAGSVAAKKTETPSSPQASSSPQAPSYPIHKAPRRIIVGSDGVGRVERAKTTPAVDISSLPRVPSLPPERGNAVRKMLASAQS